MFLNQDREPTRKELRQLEREMRMDEMSLLTTSESETLNDVFRGTVSQLAPLTEELQQKASHPEESESYERHLTRMMNRSLHL
jgi:hypothetical protein